MNETYELQLTFENGEGKSKKITIKNPKQSLTEAEILPAMDAIIGAELFEQDGVLHYTKVKNARYVRTTVEDIIDVEE